MKLHFLTAQQYTLDGKFISVEAGEAEVDDVFGEIAMGAGWAVPVEGEKAKPAPANKAKKPEANK